MKRLALIAAALALAGCSEPIVTPVHIERAQELCSVNGGLKHIYEPTRKPEYESCGYKCSRSNGMLQFRGKVRCMNGAEFELEERRAQGSQP